MAKTCTLKDLNAKDKEKVGNLLRKVVELSETNASLQNSIDSTKAEYANATAQLNDVKKRNKQLAHELSTTKHKLGSSLSLLQSYQHRLKAYDSHNRDANKTGGAENTNKYAEQHAQAGTAFFADRVDAGVQHDAKEEELVQRIMRDIGTSMQSVMSPDAVDACVGPCDETHADCDQDGMANSAPATPEKPDLEEQQQPDLLQMVAEAIGDELIAHEQQHVRTHATSVSTANVRRSDCVDSDRVQPSDTAKGSADLVSSIGCTPDSNRLLEAIERLEVTGEADFESDRQSVAASYGEELTDIIDDLESCKGEDEYRPFEEEEEEAAAAADVLDEPLTESSDFDSEDIEAIELDAWSRALPHVTAVA